MRSCGNASKVVFLMQLLLGQKMALVCSSHGFVLLLKAIGLGEGCLGLCLGTSKENSNLLLTVVEGRELIEKGRECLTVLGGKCTWSGFGRQR